MKNIICMLKQAVSETDLKVSDETIFSEAVKIYVSMGIQKGYSDNVGKNEINDSGTIETPNSSNKITDKQLKALLKISKNPDGEKFLQSKKITSEEDLSKLTKKQAWEIMNEYNT